MNKNKTDKISAKIDIIGINPFVYLPDNVLHSIFVQAQKDKGHIPVKGTINNIPYKQTLVKYSGEWRLYINATMLKNSPKRIGEIIEVTIVFDPSDRTIKPHPKLVEALNNHLEAKSKLDNLAPSIQKEMVRYISALKTEEAQNRIIERAINYLFIRKKYVY